MSAEKIKKANEDINLWFFSRSEFYRNDTDWFPYIDPRLLVLLDSLRCIIKSPIAISPHPRAVGRNDGDSSSMHNIDKHGRVFAVDTLPAQSYKHKYISTYVRLAKELGFTGIGVYPDWTPRPGLHLDTRTDRDVGNPATWGYVDGEFVSIDKALEVIDARAD